MTARAFHPSEIQSILAQTGYSSNQRAQKLKSLLTELEQTAPENRDDELEQFAMQVRKALDGLQQ
ncbi:MAG: hypothetical protein HKN11_18545 [Rhizobiales bacterium]|nr:hypothetical protein [Hyphomicrobiales bacterium]